MLRQVDWAWVALGAVESHHERPVNARVAADRVSRIAPSGSAAERARAASERPAGAAIVPAKQVLAPGS